MLALFALLGMLSLGLVLDVVTNDDEDGADTDPAAEPAAGDRPDGDALNAMLAEDAPEPEPEPEPEPGVGGTAAARGGDDGEEIDGGAGDDILSGEAGNDRITGGDGDDILSGGAGADTLAGGDGDDLLEGRVLAAGADARDVTDADGADHLSGGAGDDLLMLGTGDTGEGGAGADSFIAGSWVGAPVPTITDFDPETDRLVIGYAGDTPGAVTVETSTTGEGSPLALVRLDGQPVASVAGATGAEITADAIALVPLEETL